MIKYFNLLILVVVLHSCSSNEKAQQIIDESIAVHGFDQTVGKTISFDFRGRKYSVAYEEGQKIYTRSFQDSTLGEVKDVLVNSTEFKRYANDTLVQVSDEWAGRYTSSVNSVLYFFQLPYGLNDPAVIKKFMGQKIINDEVYNKIKVSFRQEGGGEDHQDVFIYWFNDMTKTLDFLAYSYDEDDGRGMRFRQAINRREIDGCIIQDYVNYEPISSHPELENLDKAFESGNLKELSRIENLNVQIN